MYLTISFSYTNTDILLREKLYFDDAQSLKMLKSLHGACGISEIMLLSTCNRTEVYVFIDNYQSDTKDIHINVAENIISSIANNKNLSFKELKDIAQIETQSMAIHHVFSLASSLLSLALGETQISGQLKHAYKLSYDNNLCGNNLTRLMHFAFRCAASVRSSTDISKNPISVASVAVNEAINFLSSYDVHNHRSIGVGRIPKVLIIGVGEMGVLCLKHFNKHKVVLTLCNRTKENAYKVLSDLKLSDSIDILDFSMLENNINDYDVVISASAGGIIVYDEFLKNKNYARLFIDLSVPRNFSFDSNSLVSCGINNINVLVVDDLKTKVQDHIDSRKESAKIAMGIVGQFVIDFEHWLSRLGIDPIIKLIRQRAKDASMKEINRAIRKGFIPEALRDNALKMLHSAFNEFLHSPTVRLKKIVDDESSDTVLESISRVFGDGNDGVMLNRYRCEYDFANKTSSLSF